ncbi:metallophosphoesterase family protein [Bacteroidota bacterium]
MKKFTTILFAIVIFLHLSPEWLPGQDLVTYSGDISNRGQMPTFIIFGDTQRTGFWEFWREQNEEARCKLFRKLNTEDPAFIIHLGDFVFQGSDKGHWIQFDKYMSDLQRRGIPLLPVLGNHEYFGNNKTALKNYFSHFPFLDEAKWTSFRFQSLGIILLNSNFEELNDDEINEQNSWYLSKLHEFNHDSNVQYILVACHHPPFTNSTLVSDSRDVQEYFVTPTQNMTKVKLFISGHCHSYEHFKINYKHFIVTGGGGGPRQKLEIRSTKRKHKDLYNGGEIRNIHFCRLSILPGFIKFQMVCINDDLTDWSVGEEFLIHIDNN